MIQVAVVVEAVEAAHLQSKINLKMNTGEIVLYQNQYGSIKIDVRLEDETVWLTQDQMCLLFGKAKSTINEHIKNVFEEGELNKEVAVRNFRITTPQD